MLILTAILFDVMAPRPKSHRKNRPGRRLVQDSPFLDLPGEIITQIYRCALLKQDPIDLWPGEAVLDPSEFPQFANPSEWVQLMQRKEKHVHSHNVIFRRQRHLQYVRKEMATGLLGTCSQIYYEVVHIFWSENTWRFSSDQRWEGLLRFLLTIGSPARSKLRRIEIFAPLMISRIGTYPTTDSHSASLATYWNSHPATYWNSHPSYCKNHPKTHMAKLEGEYRSRDDNYRQVIKLLDEEKVLKELRFIVPREWSLDREDYEQELESSLIPEVHLPMFASMQWLRQVVVFEEGATMIGANYIDILTKEGLDIICRKGSRMVTQSDPPIPSDELAAECEYHAHDELKPLTALSELFKEDPEISVSAKGGKANKRSNCANPSRVLKGFGGCRFVWRPGAYCVQCQRPRPTEKAWIPRDCVWRLNGLVQRGFCRYEWRTALELKKPNRAARLGVIRPRDVLPNE